MSPTSSGHTAIEQCLKEEVVTMSSLAELLKKEQSALVDSDVSLLNDYTQSKGQLVGKMSELEKKRNAFLTQLGYRADLDGMKAYLQQAGRADDAGTHWDQLLQLSMQAKEDNKTNGLLINRRLAQSQAMLSVLQQGNQSASPMYGPNGQSTIKGTSGKGYIAT
ncbi:flagella synthesis protein FlgN [Undibacterium sp. Di26W]|uniref:flagella synthesis protein FlgN n=1 Tax=Undibacterium sp. Di26W TaxID=3413035 RepID=UPI003BF221CD